MLLLLFLCQNAVCLMCILLPKPIPYVSCIDVKYVALFIATRNNGVQFVKKTTRSEHGRVWTESVEARAYGHTSRKIAFSWLVRQVLVVSAIDWLSYQTA